MSAASGRVEADRPVIWRWGGCLLLVLLAHVSVLVGLRDTISESGAPVALPAVLLDLAPAPVAPPEPEPTPAPPIAAPPPPAEVASPPPEPEPPPPPEPDPAPPEPQPPPPEVVPPPPEPPPPSPPEIVLPKPPPPPPKPRVRTVQRSVAGCSPDALSPCCANPGTAGTHRCGAVTRCGSARNLAGRAARPSGAVQALSRASAASRRTGGHDGPLRDEPRWHGTVGRGGTRLRPRRPGSGGAGLDTARPAIAQATARGRTRSDRVGRPAALRTALRQAIRTFRRQAWSSNPSGCGQWMLVWTGIVLDRARPARRTSELGS